MNNTAAKYSAYAVAEAPVRTERGIEYQAFAEVTSALTKSKSKGQEDFPQLAEAVHANRRLWNLLAQDVASDENKLPVEFRAQIFSLSIFVGKQTAKILEGNATVETLIEINRNVMVGLRN